jgi:hypothetical protein
LDDIHKVLVPLHNTCSYWRKHSQSPTANEYDVCYLQWRRCNLILTVQDIAQAQKDNEVLKRLSKHDKYYTQSVGVTQLFCKDGKRVIPTFLQNQAVTWYHQYLQHPGHTHLEETLHAAIY